MKHTLKSLLCNLLIFLCALSANSGTLYWDADTVATGNSTTGTGLGGVGLWTSSSLNFWVSGAGSDSAYVSGSDVVFAGTAGTVGLSSDQTINSMTFNTTGYTLTNSKVIPTGSVTFNVATNCIATIGSTMIGSAGYIMAGPGTLQLTNNANNTSNTLSITGGTLELTKANPLGAGQAGSTLNISNGATLQNNDVSAGGLFALANYGIVLGAGGGVFNLTNGSQILLCTNVVSGGGSLTKSGPGELRVTKAASYTGGLTVNGGMMTAGHSTVSAANTFFGGVPAAGISNAITIQNGSQLRLAGSGNLTLDTKQGITMGTGGGVIRSVAGLVFTLASPITGAGNITFDSSVDTGTISITGTNTYTGNTTIGFGTIALNGSSPTPFGYSPTVNLNGGVITLSADRGTSVNTLTNAFVIGGSNEIQAATTTGTRNFPIGGPVSSTGGSWTFHNTETTNGGGILDVRLTNAFTFAAPINLKVDVAGNNSQLSIWNTSTVGDQEYDGVISGAGSVRRSITTANTGGRAILTSSNTYSGGTSLNDGEIAFGSSSSGPAGAPTNGPIGTGTLTIGNGAGKLSAWLGARTVGNNLFFNSTPLAFIGSNNLTMSGLFDLNNSTRTLNVSNTGLTLISGVISNGNLTVSGTGVLTLSASNVYAGNTVVTNGATLALTNLASINTTPIINISSNSFVDVTGLTSPTLLLASGQTLRGRGTVNGAVEIQGGSFISPGSSPGKITTGSETWDSGGTYVWEMNNSAGSEGSDPGWDFINDTGSLTVASSSGTPFTIKVVSLTGGNAAGSVTNFSAANAYSWRIAHAASGISGFSTANVVLNTASFSNSIVNGTGSGVFALSLANSGQDLMLTFTGFPAITVQPTNSLNNPGDTAVFSVTATGPALGYQWLKNGFPITDQTNATLSLANVQAGDAGSYSVTVSNSVGSVTSTAASLIESQAISFMQGNVTYGVAPIALNGIASSGLAVSYAVVSGPASVSGSTLTITGAGSVTVRADQIGNSYFTAAAPVSQTFTANQAALTITADNGSKECGQTKTFAGTEFTTSTLIGSDSVTSVTLTSAGASSSATSADYPIVASAAVGAGITNYNITFVDGLLTVSDTQAPVISYIFTNLVVGLDTNCSAVMPDLTGTNYLIATDACSGTNITITQEPTNTAVLALGTNTVVFSIADESGNTIHSTNTFVVADTNAPIVTLNGSAGVTIECHTSYTELGASATDDCSGVATLSTNGVVDADTPGFYHISYVATDGAGNSTTNTRTVTVEDTAKPVVTLNGLASVLVECHGSYTELGATANDTCAGSVSVTTTGSVDVNTPGIYTLTYSATDPSGNIGSAQRTVTVSDTQPPVITYYFTNAVLNVDTNCSVSMPDVTGTNYIIATDGCSGTNIIITQTPTNNAVLSLGTNEVVIAIADQSGNTVYSTNTIVVQDATAPVVTLNGFASITVECHTGYTELGATAADNCTLSSLTTNGVVDVNTPGYYHIDYVATDAVGNSATNTRTVSVSDTTSPVVTLNGSATVTVECHGSYTELGATADDTCAGSVSVTTTGSVDVNTPGIYTLTYSATDPSGNIGTTHRTVTVSDTAKPVVTLNGSSSALVECHGSYSELGATAEDACAGSLSVTTSGTVDVNTPGIYTLTYSAIDPSGNTGSAQRTVTVSDTQPPVITYHFTNAVLNVDTNCSVLMPDVTGTNYIIAADGCSGTNIIITQTPTNNAVLPLGTNEVVIAIADQSGNTVYSTNTIVVQDVTAPVITLNGSSTVTVECHSGYSELGATATDNCTLSSLTTNGVVNANSPGNYTITYIATDASGNSSTNTRLVAVLDTTAPTAYLTSTSVNLSLGTNCTAILPDYTSLVVANDACSGVVNIHQTPASGTVLGAGLTLVSFTVDDGNGNTNSSSAVLGVNVIDSAAPVILSGPLSVTNGVGSSASFSVAASSCSDLGYQWYFSTNALSGQTNSTLTINPVTSADAGDYHVVVSSVGGSTASATATLTVTVDVPVIVSQQLLGTGDFQITFHSTAGQTYQVLGTEQVTDLLTTWSVLSTGTFGTNDAVFTDTNTVDHTQRFYIIKSP